MIDFLNELFRWMGFDPRDVWTLIGLILLAGIAWFFYSITRKMD